MSLVSPKAAMAKNALAERAKGGKGTDEGENAGADEQRDLPYEEYVDFLETYEDDKWWLNKEKDSEQAKDT